MLQYYTIIISHVFSSNLVNILKHNITYYRTRKCSQLNIITNKVIIFTFTKYLLSFLYIQTHVDIQLCVDNLKKYEVLFFEKQFCIVQRRIKLIKIYIH